VGQRLDDEGEEWGECRDEGGKSAEEGETCLVAMTPKKSRWFLHCDIRLICGIPGINLMNDLCESGILNCFFGTRNLR